MRPSFGARQTSYGCLYRVYIESSVPGKQVVLIDSDYIDDPSKPLKCFSAPPSRWKGRENRKDFLSYYRNKWLRTICHDNAGSVHYHIK